MSAPPLEARDLHVAFGDTTVLDGVSLTVGSGELVAVVGENGAGKSTLLRACAGLLAPRAGQVIRRGKVGYCPQSPGLIELLTAGEHLALFGERGHDLLEQLGFPSALVDTRVVRDLSGGTRQKLNLALALLDDPRILLLDEPYQGFDMGAYLDFWALLDTWRARGPAIVVVTHMLTELHRVDRVVDLTPVPA